jgi:aminodeoxyfutalosine synthase
VLERLREAGLGSLPGGGAEIFHPEVREIICDGKLDADEWIEVHRTAHRMGIHSNCTMLYGHVEKPEHKVDHLLRLRELQDETGGFNAFIPLAYHPENNYMGLKYHTTGTRRPAPPGGRPAGARQHPAHQGLLGDGHAEARPGGAALRRRRPGRHGGRGADLPHGRGRDVQQMTRAELERVSEAGFVPVERDTLYNPIARTRAGAGAHVPAVATPATAP